VSHHLSGGGSAIINLPAVDFIEDIIAAGDVINIYFNTHRSNENIYNIGTVRTFFGYVDSVTKSISVGLGGKKLTSYTINCKDFSKAIRYTEIYSNEHLASQSQGLAKNILRKDIKSNLGGIALLSKGIALQGGPRKVIVQNLLRFIGFGGQWALPTSYEERLPNSSHNLAMSKGTKDATIQDIFGILGAAQIRKESTSGDPPQLIVTELADVINELVKEGDYAHTGIGEVWKSYGIPHPTASPNKSSKLGLRISRLKTQFNTTRVEAVIEETKGEGLINNTFFKVAGVNSDQYRNNMRTIKPDVFVEKEFQGLDSAIKLALQNVLDEIGAIDPDLIKELNATPKANLYAEPLEKEDYKTPVRTLFNILCLDYLEDVKGFWAKPSFMFHQGTLYNALQQGTNSTMNELFFDLRPTPEFMVAGKDGLGIPMEGAMPMVPAVVLRLKPFTNYPPPSGGFGTQSGSISVGGFGGGSASDAGKIPPMLADQLVVNSGGVLGTGAADTVGEGDLEKSDLKKIGDAQISPSQSEGLGPVVDVTEITPPSNRKLLMEGPEAKGATESEKNFKASVEDLYLRSFDPSTGGVDPHGEALVKMVTLAKSGIGSSKIQYKAAQDKAAGVAIARKAVANYVTLPRPIFRSPDNNRITKELDQSQAEIILGVMKKGEGDEDIAEFHAIKVQPESEGYGGIGTPASSFVSESPNDLEPSMGGATPLLQEGTSAGDFAEKAKASVDNLKPEELAWHVLDYMVIHDTEVKSETYTRGDFEVKNIVEYWGAAIGGVDHQRYFLGTAMPIITPLSVYRFGVRPWTGSTEFIQAILTGGVSHNHQRNTLLRWVVLQDLWSQHNHELLGGTMNIRGMPGIRVGYRIDRPEKNISVYVDQVSHSWSFPGELSTSISFSRGQPMGADNALPYAPPISNVDPENTERQNLGKVFKTSEFKQNGVEYKLDIPGTFTGAKGIGRQIDLVTRKSPPELPEAEETKDKPAPKKAETPAGEGGD